MHQSQHDFQKTTLQVYSHRKEKLKRRWAYTLLFVSTGLFILSALGVLNGLSEYIQQSLEGSLGFTNKWSETFGPSWFVHLMSDVAALGGKVIIFFATSITIGYYWIRHEHKKLWKFVIVVIGGGTLLIGLKLAYAQDVPYEPVDLFISSIANFPSGHAMMSMIFYLTIAVFLTRKQRRTVVRKYTLIVASLIVILVGLARLFGAQHSLSEVIAGWSAGLAWLCLCWFADRYFKIHYSWDF